jgi:ankyrin repeat protein
MNLLSLPAEILLSNADHLFYNNLNSLLQTNHRLFYLLSPPLRTHAFTDKDDMPALHWACQNGYLSLVRIILDKDTSLISCHRNKTKKAPIWHAIQGGNELIVRLLLEKGAPAWTESRNRLDPPLLYIAVENGHVGIEAAIGTQGTGASRLFTKVSRLQVVVGCCDEREYADGEVVGRLWGQYIWP